MHSVTHRSFAEDVLDADRPVVVDFTAAWCPPCRVMAPVLAELAGERPDVAFVAVDVDAEPDLAARFGVGSMPTFAVFRGGQRIAQWVGARPKRAFVQQLDAALAA